MAILVGRSERSRRTRSAPLNLAIVGYGFRGHQWEEHVRRHPDVEVGSVIDPRPDLTAPYGVQAFSSLDRASLARADVAIIASPPQLHLVHAAACAEAGVSVLIEKPLAGSLADAAAVLECCARGNVGAVVGQNFRFRAPETAIREALTDGAIGPMTKSTVTSLRPRGTARATWGDEATTELWDIVIHHLDSIRRRPHGPPDAVEATASGHDGFVLRIDMRWDSGARLLFTHTDTPQFFHHHEWVGCTNGGLLRNDDHVWLVTAGRRPRRLRRRVRQPEIVLLDLLVEAHRQQSVEDLKDNLATVAFATACATSLKESRVVDLESLGKDRSSLAR